MSGHANHRSRKLLIVGAGGLGSEYVWVAEEMNAADRQRGHSPWEILGFVDDDLQRRSQIFAGYFIHGNIEEACAKFGKTDLGFAVAIGNNKAREQVARQAEALGLTPETLIHPSAIVAGTAEVGRGSYLAPGTVVCPGARVGRHVILNTHVSVGHDSTLEDFVQLCPGSRISGGCRVGKSGFLGSNASLAPKIVVGEMAVVGANSLAIRKVAPRTTVLGCPAITIGRSQL
jgi:sugar O-acyltransferase (sialic acid O-acetyltransferase NeuD family)